MTQMQSVMDFCDSVENQKEAEVTIIQVSSLGGFSVYHLQTEKWSGSCEKMLLRI